MAHQKHATALTVELLETKVLLSGFPPRPANPAPPSPIGQPIPSPRGQAPVPGLADRLTSNNSVYQAGQPIQLAFIETNISGHTIKIGDGPSQDGFVVLQDGKIVWRSNAGVTPLYIRLVTLRPGQSLTLTWSWNGVPNTGGASTSSVDLGTFVAFNQQDPAAMATFQIVGSSSQPPSPGSPSPTSPSSPSSPDPSSPSPGSPSIPAPVTATLTTDHTVYHRGHVVHFTLTLTDVGDSAVNLTPNPATDGFIVSRGTTVVWRRTPRSPAFTAHTLQPGQSVQVSALWNGRPNQPGSPNLRPGTYTVQVEEDGFAGSATITIGRGR
jgi:hypothetical protein